MVSSKSPQIFNLKCFVHPIILFSVEELPKTFSKFNDHFWNWNDSDLKFCTTMKQNWNGPHYFNMLVRSRVRSFSGKKIKWKTSVGLKIFELRRRSTIWWVAIETKSHKLSYNSLSLWRKANARKCIFETFYVGQFNWSTQLIKRNYSVILS